MKKTSLFASLLPALYAGAIGLLLASCLTAQLTNVLYTNFRPLLAYDTSNSYPVSGASFGKNVIAMRFQPSVNATFENAFLALSSTSGPNQLSVYLETDKNGLPGSIIEQIKVTGLNSTPSIINAMSARHPLLLAGTYYWLVAAASDPGTLAGWNYNSNGDNSDGSNFAFNVFGSATGPWTKEPSGFGARAVFQINGIPLDAFQVGHFTNLKQGDSFINLSNDGSVVSSFTTTGGAVTTDHICVNVYTFEPYEALVSCCSCMVSANALFSLSARNDLLSNTLAPIQPASIVVKLIASTPIVNTATGMQSCNAAAPTSIYTLLTGNPSSLVGSLRAWGTTLLPVTVATGTTYNAGETKLSSGHLGSSEFNRITRMCGFIQANGSGFGICRSCRVGGLGGAAQ